MATRRAAFISSDNLVRPFYGSRIDDRGNKLAKYAGTKGESVTMHYSVSSTGDNVQQEDSDRSKNESPIDSVSLSVSRTL
jgi:hypothetical protein